MLVAAECRWFPTATRAAAWARLQMAACMKYSAVSLAPPEPRALRLHARTSSPPKPGASLSTLILNLLLLADGERLVMGLPFASSAARLHDISLQGCAIFLWSIMSMKVHFSLHSEPLTSAVACFLPPHCLQIGS